jgi:hypothetical protein
VCTAATHKLLDRCPPVGVPTSTQIARLFGPRGVFGVHLFLTSLVAYLHLAGCWPNPVVAVRESLAPFFFGPSLGLLRPELPHPRGQSPLFPSSFTYFARPLLSVLFLLLSLTVEVVARRTTRTVSRSNQRCCADLVIGQLPHQHPQLCHTTAPTTHLFWTSSCLRNVEHSPRPGRSRPSARTRRTRSG